MRPPGTANLGAGRRKEQTWTRNGPRLRINLSQREFEVEGSESFVRAYAEQLDSCWRG